MRTATMLLLALLLAGCFGREAAPPPPPRIVRVPVPVPCKIEAPARPAWEFDKTPAEAGIDEQVRALLVEREQRTGYEGKLEAAITACQ